MNRSTCGRGDDTNRFRESRQGSFAIIGEQALGGQLLLTRFKSRLQLALPRLSQGVNDQLHFTTCDVNSHRSGADDLGPIFRGPLDQTVPVTEHHSP